MDGWSVLHDYCEKMSMSYSYKPVLILAVLNNNGMVSLDEAALFFLNYYSARLEQGLIAEKRNSIYSNLNCTYEQVKQNINNNPVKALLNSSDCFVYNRKNETLAIEPDLWNAMPQTARLSLHRICFERLDRYFAAVQSAELSNLLAFQMPQDINGYLSNDYSASFSIAGVKYSSVTQYMVYRKALLAGDEALGRHILTIDDIGHLKTTRITTKPLIELSWNAQKQLIAYKGILAKFVQNDRLTDELLDTGSMTLAACLPDDCVWGNGLPIADARVTNISAWPGENLLGYTLMQVRSALYSTRTF